MVVLAPSYQKSVKKNHFRIILMYNIKLVIYSFEGYQFIMQITIALSIPIPQSRPIDHLSAIAILY